MWGAGAAAVVPTLAAAYGGAIPSPQTNSGADMSSLNPPTGALPFSVVETITRGGTTFEVLEYSAPGGSEPFSVAEQVFTLGTGCGCGCGNRNRVGGRC